MKLFWVLLCVFWQCCAGARVKYAGVNLAGAEFGENYPGVYDLDYTFPTTKEVDYYRGKGMNVFRLPFKWERLQPRLNGSFDSAYLGKIDDFVKYATRKGAFVILDVHNYARYYETVISSQRVPSRSFAHFWSRLASLYKRNSKVMFGLMNEPYGLSTEGWLDIANEAISAIRKTKARNLILVPGNGFTGAWSWVSDSWYGTPNAEVMKGIKDSAKKFAFDVHQYFDADFSGTKDDCLSVDKVLEKMGEFTEWCRKNKFRAFLGEFAGARNQQCYDAIRKVLNYLEDNSGVYLGWTWWAGGPWWKDYMFSLEPQNNQDQPQMEVLEDFL